MKEGSAGQLTLDRALVVRSWDAWMAEATGLGEDEACGAALPDLYPDIRERGFIPLLEKVLLEGTVSVLAPAFHGYFIPCPTRGPSPYFERMQQRVTIAPLRAGETIEGIVIHLEDVTARRDEERRFGERITSPDERVRIEAVREVAESSARADLLSEAFGDTSWRVRRSAAQAAAQDDSAAAADLLITLLRDQHRDLAVLNAAIAAAARSRADVLPRLIPLLEEPDEDLRNYVALVLGLLGDSRAVPHLVGLLEDSSVNVRFHAIEALGRIADLAAVESILPIAKAADFFLTPAACEALAAIGDEGVVPELIPLLDDPMLAPVALDAIGRLGGAEAVAPVLGTLATGLAGPDEVAITLAGIHDRAIRRGAEGAIPALTGSLAQATVARDFIDAFESADADGRLAIVQVSAWLDDADVDDLLMRALDDPQIQSAAVEGLIARRSHALPALVERLGHLEPRAAAAAAVALGRIGKDSVAPALLHLLEQRPELAVTIAAALGGIGSRDALDPLLDLIGNEDPAVRQAAVGALNSIGHPEMAARTAQLASSDSPRLRESAARITCYFGYPGAFDAVLRLTRDPVESVRRTAVEHLLTFDDPRVDERLREVLTTDTPAVRAAAARSLTLLEEDGSPGLLLLALEDGDLWVRYHAARSASSSGDPRVASRLRELAESDPVVPVRIAAITALAAHADADALPLLVGMSEPGNDEEIVREALVAVAGNLGADAITDDCDAADTERPASTTEAALARIIDVIRNGPAPLRAALLEATPPLREPALLDALLELIDRSSSERTLILALRALLRSDLTAPLVRRLLAPASGAGVQAASRRERIVDAVAEVAGTRLLPELGVLLKDEDPAIRFTALEVLARLEHPELTALVARALDDESPQVCRFAALLLERHDLRQAVAASATAPSATRQAATRE